MTASVRPWRRGLVWLALLGPFFYLSYGVSNHLASLRESVPSLVFAWEYAIPFWAWTILPYWSINGFYVASLFVHRDAADVDAQGRRLLTAQIIAVTCFLLFPLRISFARPDTAGWAGALFDALTSFDKPFNQAPSLHIALLVILWELYASKLGSAWRWLLHLWFFLIGASVLTTYQHHFIDIPTGALLGAFCLWCWPLHGEPPWRQWRWGLSPAHTRLALRYGAGSLAFALLALPGGTWLWSLWPAVSLALVALAYAGMGPDLFQKSADGRLGVGARLLLLPYLFAARVNQWLWTRGEPSAIDLGEGVSLGRIPRWRESLPGEETLIDLSAELDSRRDGVVQTWPSLDLVPPPVALLRAAADALEQARQRGPVRVACALGRSRSASVVLTWWLRSGRAASLPEAEARLRALHPKLVLHDGHRDAITAAWRE